MNAALDLSLLSPKERATAHLMTDLQDFCAFGLKVKPKVGRNVPFVWNRAQHHVHDSLEAQIEKIGFVRALVLKGRQQGMCYSPDMRVLTADYRWVRIGDLELGERLVAVDENTGNLNGAGRKTERRIRTAVVEAKVSFRHEAFEVELDGGVRLIVTGEHRHLCRKRGGDDAQWRTVADMKVGDHIRTIAHAPGCDAPSFEDGWMAGLLDGEGSFSASPAIRIALSQVDGPVLRRAKRYLEDRGINYYELIDSRLAVGQRNKLGDKPVHCLRIDRQSDIMKLMSMTRPSRFVDRELFAGKKMPKSAPGFNAWARVISIKAVGMRDVVDIQTSEKTFICEGIVSHNSTYVGARYYHKTSTRKSTSAFIVAHEDKSTSNLFEMVKRYHSSNPLAPSTKYSNAKELLFGRLDSGYKLATAGSQDVGRGNTAQLLHGSEFGFWQNPQMHLAGLGNTIADAPGTEIVLESTGNGLGNAFHLMWQEAEAGRGLYIPIFVPWFWQEEYRAPLRGTLDLSVDDELYMAAFGLDMEQMQWRADKIASYGSGFEWLFDQEYPATPAMAFQSSTANPLIRPTLTARAMASDLMPDPRDPLIIGCDPAEQGFDRTAIAFRRGRVLLRIEYEDKSNTMGVVGRLAQIWRDQRPDAMFLDKGGLGAGIYDRLLELNVPVIGVNSASRARDHELYENRRAEMWWTMLEWFEDEPCRIPRTASALASDLSAPEPRLHSSGRRLLEKKADMKKRGMRSPDGGDALALTFYEPVARRELMTGPSQEARPATRAGY